MTHVSNWRAVLLHAWSTRLLYIVMLVNGLEAALWLVGSAIPGPVWVRAVVSFAIACAATYSRIVLQPKLTARVERTSEGFDVDYWHDRGRGS